MKRLVFVLCSFFVLCSLIICILTGCGHNVATHSKGYGIDISWNQDSLIPNVRLGYWDVSYAMIKENVELKMESNAGIGANLGDANSEKKPDSSGANAGGNASNKIEIKTGMQINGYTKDMLNNPNLNAQTVEAIQALKNKNK